MEDACYLVLRLYVMTKCQVLKRIFMATEHLGVLRKLAQDVDQGLVHLFSTTLKEPAATSKEESVPGEDDLVTGLGDVVADMASGVARSEQT